MTLQLHVWGTESKISLISPECLASSWLLCLILSPKNIPFEIIPSNNTNLSDINKLPVLIINGNEKCNGYKSIVDYLETTYPNSSNSSYINLNSLDKRYQLSNLCLINILETKLEYINQYNLYSNNQNYEKYTRKLFQYYFPFPMMYNQPMKFYNHAIEQVKLLGLNRTKTGFFGLGGGGDVEVAETEYFNDELSDNDEDEGEGEKKVVLSSLHERQLISKSKANQILAESKNSMRCLGLLNHYINEFIQTYKSFNQDTEESFGTIYSATTPSSAEILLYAYISSLISDELPDGFILSYLNLNHGEFVKFCNEQSNKYRSILQENKDKFRKPEGIEIPNLLNEIGYWIGTIKY